jgi:hypothetical protein
MDSALSLVEISPSNGHLEVTHTLFAHDLEGALGAGSVDLSWFEKPEGELALRSYCLEKFSLIAQNGRPIRLTFVGVELNGAAINVYFESPRPRGRQLTIDSNFLQERSDNQVNRVNLRANGVTISAVFMAGALPKRMTIP